MEVDVAEVGTLEGKKVARSLLRDECLDYLLCLFFALHMRHDKLVFHEINEGPS